MFAFGYFKENWREKKKGEKEEKRIREKNRRGEKEGRRMREKIEEERVNY